MSLKREVVGFVAAAFIPPLAATQLLSAQGKLADGLAWLAVLGVLISSTSAAAIYTLTMLNKDAGNPPVPSPAPAPAEAPNGV